MRATASARCKELEPRSLWARSVFTSGPPLKAARPEWLTLCQSHATRKLRRGSASLAVEYERSPLAEVSEVGGQRYGAVPARRSLGGGKGRLCNFRSGVSALGEEHESTRADERGTKLDQ